MGELTVKEKSIAVPGETLAKGMDFLPGWNTYRDNEDIVAGKLGLVQVDGRTIKLIQLSGRYLPKRDDTLIGKVIDITMNGWRIDLESAYPAMLPLKDATSEFIKKGQDLSRIYDIGDYLVARVSNVTSQNLVDLSMIGPGLRRLTGGRTIQVNTHKVPRIIGTQGSMITMIKDATNTRIVVGQNGVIWIQGEPEGELKAVEAIREIEEKSHLSGLTERIKAMLVTETKVSGTLENPGFPRGVKNE